MRRLMVLLAIWIAVLACERVERVSTAVSLQLPADDPGAELGLARLDIELWPRTLRLCDDFRTWWRAHCNPRADCEPFDRASILPGTPKFFTSLTSSAGGFLGPSLILEEEDRPDVLVLGFREGEAQPYLLGCASADFEMPLTIALARPWCSRTVECVDEYKEACILGVECGLPGDKVAPSCAPLANPQFSWEEDRLGCPPEGGDLIWPGACSPAQLDCEKKDGELFGMVVSDGVCPLDQDQDCMTDSDCNGATADCDLQAICEMDVSSTATAACDLGLDNACVGISACSRGRATDCTPLNAEEESCNGLDDDCDGVPDEADGDAQRACLLLDGRRAPDCRRISEGDYACGCGDARPCAEGLVCCNSACMKPRQAEVECGCGDRCSEDQVCQSGSCQPLNPDAGVPGPTDVGVDVGIDAGVDLGPVRPDLGFEIDLGAMDSGILEMRTRDMGL